MEDGTGASIWGFRIFGGVFFAIGFILSLISFLGVLGGAGSIIMYILYFIIPIVCILIYAISQIVLAMQSAGDMWPIGILYFFH